MQVCTSLQTDNHASNQPLSFLQADALPAAQPAASKSYSNRVTNEGCQLAIAALIITYNHLIITIIIITCIMVYIRQLASFR